MLGGIVGIVPSDFSQTFGLRIKCLAMDGIVAGLTVSRALCLAVLWAVCLMVFANIYIQQLADLMFGGSRTFTPSGMRVECLAVV